MDHQRVVVVGGGPVGLMVACELALRGVGVTVLERRTEIDQTIKAGSINVPTGEAFYRRGLEPALAQAQRMATEAMMAFIRQRMPAGAPVPQIPKPAGHFAGIWAHADAVDADDPDFGEPGPAAGATMVRQQEIEAILGDRAADLGVDVRRGVAMTGLDADADGVNVHTDAGVIAADWLVGCDGGRSQVRKYAGFDFPGTDGEITGHQAVVTMDGAQALQPGWNRTSTGIYANGPTPGRILTVEMYRSPAQRDDPITAAELQDSIWNVTGVEVTVTGVSSATRFTDNARQVSSYRRGRVLLAGDAAHVHSPFGGQGLNLGIGDAMNLGWKLAAVLDGWAGDELLDTYTAERHPIGAWVLQWSRAQVALMRLDQGTNALRDVVSELMSTGGGATFFVKKISGVMQRYDLCGTHALVGRSAPDLVLEHDGGTSRLGQHLHSGNGLLLDLTDPGDANPAGSTVRTVVEQARVPARRLGVRSARCAARPELAALLVRPDGYVAWAADRCADTADGKLPDGAVNELTVALAAWFGAGSQLVADEREL